MSDSGFHAALGRMLEAGEPFAVATVVAVRGSASGKPGSKALFDAQGRNVYGWVGGGCVERFTGEQAVEALALGKPRVILADLDDEILGLGMPCGGEMDIYVEPVRPRPPLCVAGEGAVATRIVELAAMLGIPTLACAPELEDRWQDPLVRVQAGAYAELPVPRGARVLAATAHRGDDEVMIAALEAGAPFVGLVANRRRAAALRERLSARLGAAVAGIRAPVGLDLGARDAPEIAVATLAELLAHERGVEVEALERARGAGPGARPSPGWAEPELLVVGHSRISEALVRIGQLLGWPTTLHVVRPSEHQRAGYPEPLRWVVDDPGFERLPAGPNTAVVVASHHKGDEQAIATALGQGAPYVGLIASATRSRIIRERLPELAGAAGVLRAPAGMAIGARGPVEIALSVIVEILALHRGRTGRPLMALDELPPRRRAGCPEHCEEEP